MKYLSRFLSEELVATRENNRQNRQNPPSGEGFAGFVGCFPPDDGDRHGHAPPPAVGYTIPVGRPILRCSDCGARLVQLNEGPDGSLIAVELPDDYSLFGNMQGRRHRCQSVRRASNTPGS